MGMLFGGRERIRTAVQGFADLCLATRPLDHFKYGSANLGIYPWLFKPNLQKILSVEGKSMDKN